MTMTDEKRQQIEKLLDQIQTADAYESARLAKQVSDLIAEIVNQPDSQPGGGEEPARVAAG